MVSSGTPTARRGGSAIDKQNAEEDDEQRRRSRNRVSQRHFRERRTQYIKQLEQQIQCLMENDNTSNSALVAENKALREALARVQMLHTRLASMSKGVFTTIAEALTGAKDPATPAKSPSNDNNSLCDHEPSNVTISSTDGIIDCHDSEELSNQDSFIPDIDIAESNLGEVGCSSEIIDHGTENWKSLTAFAPSDFPEMTILPMAQSQPYDVPKPSDMNDMFLSGIVGMDAFDLNGCSNPSNIMQQIEVHSRIPPSIPNQGLGTFEFSFNIRCEPKEYALLPTFCALLVQKLVRLQDASISTNLEAMMSLTREYLALLGSSADVKMAAKSYLIAVVLFNKQHRGTPLNVWVASSWGAMTCCVHTWHLIPSLRTLQALPQCYQPSELQLSTPHPRVIDVVPYSGLRDKLIQYYTNDQQLDRIYMDLIEHYVVNVSNISTIIQGAESGPGFMGVCNIFYAMSRGRGDAPARPVYKQDSVELHDASLLGLFQAHTMSVPNTSRIGRKMCDPGDGWTPLPLMEILGSTILAQCLYHHLNLYTAHETWRVDPQFYEQYPELRWDGYEHTVAVGSNHRVASDWLRQMVNPNTSTIIR